MFMKKKSQEIIFAIYNMNIYWEYGKLFVKDKIVILINKYIKKLDLKLH